MTPPPPKLSREELDPSAGYPPTRPTLKMLVIAIVLVAGIVMLINWSQVSAFAHIPQIEHSLGFGG